MTVRPANSPKFFISTVRSRWISALSAERLEAAADRVGPTPMGCPDPPADGTSPGGGTALDAAISPSTPVRSG